MNLYDLHPDPESAPYADVAFDRVPELVWKRYKDRPEELKKREKALAKNPEIAYLYARDALEGRFPAGERAIARDAEYAYDYARYVLKKPFPEGEPAIAKVQLYRDLYAWYILGLSDDEAKVWPRKLEEGLAGFLVLRGAR